MEQKIAHIIATVGGVGHMRPASGTWGSLVALPLAMGVVLLGGFWLLVLAILPAYLAGLWATQRVTAGQDNHDPSEVVVDELVGQWIAVLPVVYGVSRMGVDMLALWPGWVAAFFLFRFFDILKPGPVGWADARDDATGVMLDDVIAGVFAALSVSALAALWHGVIM